MNDITFDSNLITDFINTFYGYGRYAAPYWFVGMEEGGDRTPEENAGRIESWDRRGRPEVASLHEYHPDVPVSRWFTAYPPIQPTWGKLIRILLAAQGRPTITRNDVRFYQRDFLGRSPGDTCLLELLPLPSPSTGHWMYGGQPSLPQLDTRKIYKQHYGRLRALHIAQRVQEFKPAAVIFYSFDWWYQQWWQLIAGAPFSEIAGPHGTFYLATSDSTRFAITRHPASKGPTSEYWHWIGRTLASTEI